MRAFQGIAAVKTAQLEASTTDHKFVPGSGAGPRAGEGRLRNPKRPRVYPWTALSTQAQRPGNPDRISGPLY